MKQSKQTELWIKILSVAIPLVVAIILGIRQKIDLGEWTKQLPHYIGFTNGLTALFLLIAFVFIKNKNRKMHQLFNTAAFVLGGVFLLMYIIYHLSNTSTSSNAMESTERAIYLFFLISHILLSVVVVRYVLLAMYYAFTAQIDAHKKIVKITFPLWLYVSVSGVIVYLMISPYYQ